VCTVRIGLMHVISSIYLCYVLRSVIHMSLFVVLQVQLMDVSLCALRCNTAHLSYVCQTAAFVNRKSLSSKQLLMTSLLSLVRKSRSDLINCYQIKAST